MDVKKEGVIFLIAFLLIGSLLVGIVSADNNTSDPNTDPNFISLIGSALTNLTNASGNRSGNLSVGPEIDKEGGLWAFIVKWYNKIMDATLRPVGRFTRNEIIYRVFGYRTLSGKGKSWGNGYLFGDVDDKEAGKKWEGAHEGWTHLWFALELLILLFILHPFYGRIKITTGGNTVKVNIYAFEKSRTPSSGFLGILGIYWNSLIGYIKEFLWNWRTWFVVIYFIGMGTPILNRVLQIITLEFLLAGSLWKNNAIRVAIITVVLIFIPEMWRSYVKKRAKRYEYKVELERAAREEAAGALLD